ELDSRSSAVAEPIVRTTRAITAIPARIFMVPTFPNYLNMRRRNRGKVTRLLKRELHKDGVDPAIEFESHVPQNTGVLKAELLVDAHGGRVLTIADHGDELPAAPLLARRNQMREQKCADSVANMIRMNVYRVLERESIGDAGTIEGR